ncbi:MAG: hypothetical protein Q9222_001876 [Ikaeria aurantiellina]
MAITDEELAHLQQLSNNYGPLVSVRQSSQNITEEYAQADIVYVHKTTPALAFGYCEALLQSADPQRVLAEVARLESLNTVLNAAGYEATIYEDFVEETLQLLKRIADGFPDQDGSTALLDSFNDREICNAIIMHFRLVTSAWMKKHAKEYGGFNEDFSTIDQYCATRIEPHAVEIENLGLQTCIDAIIKPAGINVQVLVLDRTPGEQVNQLQWNAEASAANAQYSSPPTIRLLYRPYDINRLVTGWKVY